MTRRDTPHRARLAVALAVALVNAGCASPYHFSTQLHAYQPVNNAATHDDSRRLAGDLDLALAALMDQRRLLWEAAGETETMKNATALGLIGLGAAGIYRGLRGEESKAWLQRAGLIAGATYAGATWLEPDARQKIYLQGAMSLTCLALTTSAYEMRQKDYGGVRDDVAKARVGLERLASALRLAGRYTRYSDDWWLVRNGWNKLRWASGVLANADKALGNIERTGPRLRDETALVASEVARQVNTVSRDLGRLSEALAQIKPNATLLLGADFSAPPPKDAVDKDAPGQPSSDATKTGAEDDAGECKASAPPPAPAPAPAAGTVPALVAAAQAAASGAAASAQAASAAAGRAGDAAKAANGSARRAADSASAAARAAAGGASAPASSAPAPAESLRAQLTSAMRELDSHLGPVVSFVQRTAAARAALSLPPGCGTDLPTLLPSTRSIVLRPGDNFHFVMKGDSGRLSVEALGAGLARDVLDISMPVSGADAGLRLAAGPDVKRKANTVLRIADSKGRVSHEVEVTVCAGKLP
jgi:hypothetical protein